MATNPTKQQLENRKIAAAGGTPPEPGFNSNAFVSEAANRLLQTSGIISSADTTLEKAILGVEEAGRLTGERTESIFGRERGEIVDVREDLRETLGATGRGIGAATQMKRLEKFDTDTATQLKDLADRKAEALALGDAATARDLANLEVQAIRFQIEARQRVFTNLLATSQFALSAKAEERLERQQSFVVTSAIASIALEFGERVPEGATLESMVALVAPRADTRRKAELAKLIADTNRANAEAAKAIAGTKDTGFDSLTLSVLASGVLRGDIGLLDLGLDPKETALLLSFVNEQRDERTDTLIDEANRILSGGGNSGDFIRFAERSATVFDQSEIDRIIAVTFTRENLKEQREKTAAGKVRTIETGVLGIDEIGGRFGTRFLTESALEKERKKLKGILIFK